MKDLHTGGNRAKLLSIGKAAEYLGVSIDTLRRWEEKGRLTTFRSPGGHRYFAVGDLDKVFGTKYERTETKKYKKIAKEPEDIKFEQISTPTDVRGTPSAIEDVEITLSTQNQVGIETTEEIEETKSSTLDTNILQGTGSEPVITTKMERPDLIPAIPYEQFKQLEKISISVPQAQPIAVISQQVDQVSLSYSTSVEQTVPHPPMPTPSPKPTSRAQNGNVETNLITESEADEERVEEKEEPTAVQKDASKEDEEIQVPELDKYLSRSNEVQEEVTQQAVEKEHDMPEKPELKPTSIDQTTLKEQKETKPQARSGLKLTQTNAILIIGTLVVIFLLSSLFLYLFSKPQIISPVP